MNGLDMHIVQGSTQLENYSKNVSTNTHTYFHNDDHIVTSKEHLKIQLPVENDVDVVLVTVYFGCFFELSVKIPFQHDGT